MSSTQPTGWVRWHAAIPICSFCGRSGSNRRLDHKSRMGREFHVRFREGLGVKSPRATRLVICCRGTAGEARAAMQDMMTRLKLTVNETKTHICHLPDETFDFLGFTFGRYYSPRTGRSSIQYWPSRQRVTRICTAISEMTSRQGLWKEVAEQIAELNQLLIGWRNYFARGVFWKAFRAVDRHVWRRLRWWLCRKHKVRGTGGATYPLESLYDVWGVVSLERTVPRQGLPRAKP